MPLPEFITKRDGRKMPFDKTKIVDAIFRAGSSSGEFDRTEAEKLADRVCSELEEVFGKKENPNVEDVQDVVELILMRSKWRKTARLFILYREEHDKNRKKLREVPDDVRKLAKESSKYFPNELSEFVFYSTYARWIPEKGRRETWLEAIDRYTSFMRENLGSKLKDEEYAEIREAMLNMEVEGSMRLLWAAGDAARKTNVAAYNCSLVAPICWQDFAEIAYILMCGTGVGFSVEKQFVEQLPFIKKQRGKKILEHVIGDSKEGWGDAIAFAMRTLENGDDVKFDYSQIRPQGSRLKIMGGRASGPDPLRSLLDYIRAKFLQRQGGRLTTLDVHDIICKIGEVVVSGGVRRSALLSLSDLEDPLMKTAKNGQFWLTEPQRTMANNSVAYTKTPSVSEFMDEWLNLVKSGSGERGIFNRDGLKKQLPERRLKISEEYMDKFATNPCAEIILRPKQFCNLSILIARPDDTEKTLMNKIRLATILGTFQASLTRFPYLSEEWKKNCEEEALLGVSIDGQWDCELVRSPSLLRKMREYAIEVNKEYSKKFGINPSTCITCVKPSGNGSTLFNSSPGCHPRHAKYYIRRVRIESHNPLFYMLRDAGAAYHPEVGQQEADARTFVLEFPIKAPRGSIVKRDLSAIDMLEHWKVMKTNFTEHNPSTTITVRDDEWFRAGNWVYENWDIVGGLSFLPLDSHIYQLAPYEEITKEKFEELEIKFPKIDFAEVVAYEYGDTTESAKELACTSGSCMI